MPPINIYHMKIYLCTSQNNNKMKLDITSFLENCQYLSFQDIHTNWKYKKLI